MVQIKTLKQIKEKYLNTYVSDNEKNICIQEKTSYFSLSVLFIVQECYPLLIRVGEYYTTWLPPKLEDNIFIWRKIT